jgi:nucleotide-binding universal stress UspA family protein
MTGQPHPGRILVAVDPSENSRAAALWAADLAEGTGAELTAVHALGLMERVGRSRVPAQHHREEIEWAFDTLWTAPLRRPGLDVRCLLRDGPPAQVILDVADEIGADLIVVGTRGTGERVQLPLGSTSTQVVQHASCAVTVVPHR